MPKMPGVHSRAHKAHKAHKALVAAHAKPLSSAEASQLFLDHPWLHEIPWSGSRGLLLLRLLLLLLLLLPPLPPHRGGGGGYGASGREGLSLGSPAALRRKPSAAAAPMLQEGKGAPRRWRPGRKWWERKQHQQHQTTLLTEKRIGSRRLLHARSIGQWRPMSRRGRGLACGLAEQQTKKKKKTRKRTLQRGADPTLLAPLLLLLHCFDHHRCCCCSGATHFFPLPLPTTTTRTQSFPLYQAEKYPLYRAETQVGCCRHRYRGLNCGRCHYGRSLLLPEGKSRYQHRQQ